MLSLGPTRSKSACWRRARTSSISVSVIRTVRRRRKSSAQLHAAADIGKNHRYFPGRGLLPLRQAAARWYERRYHARFDPDRDLIITMGAKEGISHLCLAMLEEGDVAIAPDPCYPIHAGAPLIAGATVELYPARADVPPRARSRRPSNE